MHPPAAADCSFYMVNLWGLSKRREPFKEVALKGIRKGGHTLLEVFPLWRPPWALPKGARKQSEHSLWGAMPSKTTTLRRAKLAEHGLA